MKQFLIGNLILTPLAIFLFGWHLGVPWLGGVLALLTCAIAYGFFIYKAWDATTFVALAAAILFSMLLWWLGGTTWEPYRSAIFHATTGFVMLMSVLLLRPWTMSITGQQGQARRREKLYRLIHQIISAYWGFAYIGIGILLWQKATGLAIAALVLIGAILSWLLPKQGVRYLLQRRLQKRSQAHWPAPDFSKSKEWDVLIVGTGLGGLTAGALLANKGLKVCLLEQHSLPGGYAHSWIRKSRQAEGAFRFDAGVHDISGIWAGGPVTGVLSQLGLNQALHWHPMRHGNVKNGRHLPMPKNWADYISQLTTQFPAEAKGIQALGKIIPTIYEAMFSLGAGRCNIPTYPNTVEGLLAFAEKYPLAATWLDKPYADLLAEHLKNPETKAAFYLLSGYITNKPDTLKVNQMVPIMGYLLHGGYYPIGGSGQLVKVLVDFIEAHQGKVQLKTSVSRILSNEHGVQGLELQNGEKIYAPAVIFNGDLLTHRTNGLPEAMWPDPQRQALSQAQPACSAFMVQLGIQGNYADLPEIWHIHDDGGSMSIALTPAPDHDAAPAGYTSLALIKLIAQNEAGKWMPPAGETLASWRKNPQYLAQKAAYGDQLITRAQALIPGLKDKIVLRIDASPLTFQRYNRAQSGNIYGLDEVRLPTKTALPGLVIAGSATHGGGVEAVIISGTLAAEALLPGCLAP